MRYSPNSFTSRSTRLSGGPGPKVRPPELAKAYSTGAETVTLA